MRLQLHSRKIILLSLLLSVGYIIASPSTTHAISFNAGNIIDDYTFTNSKSMSASQIQSFLNSKVAACDTSGSQNSEMNNSGVPDYNHNGSIQRWEWGKYKFNQTSFTCLKSYKEDNLSAAQIIYNTAQQYNINSQVLIVLLQKEQGLVTDEWPTNDQYRKATGYGCPDSSPSCDANYRGFTNQIQWAAKMFRAIEDDSPSWYTPYVLGNNHILYNPISSCGGSTVNIQNRATQALYNYTPYQPNSAALRAGYGSGDSCSSYGNRNFFLYFRDWFGLGPGYEATHINQLPFPSSLAPGQSTTTFVTYRNTGSKGWVDNDANFIHLATAEPLNKASNFADASWGLGKNRPSSTFNIVYKIDGTPYDTNPHLVQPGEYVRFYFTIKIPTNYPAGTYRQYFTPVQDSGGGVVPIIPAKNWVDVKVAEAPQSTWAGQSSVSNLRGGEATTEYIDFKNTGNTLWKDIKTTPSSNAVSLVSVNSSATVRQASRFSGNKWGAANDQPSTQFDTVFNSSGQAYSTNPHVVKPGETARFRFTVTAADNETAASYREYFAVATGGGSTILTPKNSSGQSISVWSDIQVLSAPSIRPSMTSINQTVWPMTSFVIHYPFKNTGNTTLTQSSTTLRTISGDASGLQDESWPSSGILATMDQASVAPGGSGSFTVTLHSSIQASAAYSFSLAPYVNTTNAALSSTQVKVAVPSPFFKAKFQGQSGFPTIRQGNSSGAFFLLVNKGNSPWYDATSVPSGAKRVALATTNPINRISNFSVSPQSPNRPTRIFSAVYESDGATLAPDQHVVRPNQIGKFAFTLTAPANTPPGKYREWFQPILEGGRPWSMEQRMWLDITVTR